MNGLFLEIVEYIANSLLGVFSMDLDYFETAVPVSRNIFAIILAVGWALLLGNLVFQAMRSMVSGLGYEGEDPKLLFARTFLFSFLLLVSRQICDIGLGITATVIELLQVPSSIQIPVPDEIAFAIGASWLLVVIITVIILWQVVRMFFEVGERYVVTAALTILSPLAFAMGGSKSTADIFKGWVRMFGSMCLMMILNVVFLKMLLSVLAIMPSGTEMLPWTILVMGIARVTRKIDAIVTRIGLNPAITGDGLGRSNLPGVLAFTVARSLGSTVVKTMGNSGGHTPPSGGGGVFRGSAAGGAGGRANGGRDRSGASAQNGFAASTAHTAATQQSQATSPAGTAATAQATAEAAQNGAHIASHISSALGNAAQSTANHTGEAVNGQRSGANTQSTQQTGSRRSSVSPSQRAGGGYGAYGRAGTVPQTRNTFVDRTPQAPTPAASPGAQTVRNEETTTSGRAGKQTAASAAPPTATRFSVVPPTARQEPGRGQSGTGGRGMRQSSISTQQTASETRRTETKTTSGTAAPAQGRTPSDRPAPGSGMAGSAAQPKPTSMPATAHVETRNATGTGTRPVSPAQQESRPLSGATSSREAGNHAAARPPASHIAAGATARPPSPARQESKPSSSAAVPKQAAGSPIGTAGMATGSPPRSRPNTPGRPAPSANGPEAGQVSRRVAPGGKPVTAPQGKPTRKPRGGTKHGG